MPKYNGNLDDDFEMDEDYTKFQKIKRKPSRMDEDKNDLKRQQIKKVDK